MRLLDGPHLGDERPLTKKPFVVEREAWITDTSGGADYEGVKLGRFDTLAEALEFAKGHNGSIVIYEMKLGKISGEMGGSVAKLWDGKVKWIEKGHGVPEFAGKV